MGAGIASRLWRALINQVRGLAWTLAFGYVLFFWSERAFWSFFHVTDNLRELTVTWLAYSVLGAVVAALIRSYRVTAWEPLFLVGAVYGWLAEGGIVDTMYGGPGGPFPLSLSFTGLAWHALLTLGIGWWWFGRGMGSDSRLRLLGRALCLGAGWGLWAVWTQNEAGSAFSTTPAAFLRHAAATAAPLPIAWWALRRLGPLSGAPSVRLRVGLFVFVAAVLLAARFPATPMAAPILVRLLALCVWALRRWARTAPDTHAIAQLSGPYGLREAAAIVAIPATASLVYACLSWTRLPTNVLLYVITTPLGFWHFGRSLASVLRRAGNSRNSRPDEEVTNR